MLRRKLDWPVEGTRVHLASAPVMVPGRSHRYLPAGRGTDGPVLSMQQGDVITYGRDLAGSSARSSQVEVPFWREFAKG